MTVTNDACTKSTQALPPVLVWWPRNRPPVLALSTGPGAGGHGPPAPPFGETANRSCRNLETADVGHAEIAAQRRCGRRTICQSGSRTSLVALALVSLFDHAACTGSPALLHCGPTRGEDVGGYRQCQHPRALPGMTDSPGVLTLMVKSSTARFQSCLKSKW